MKSFANNKLKNLRFHNGLAQALTEAEKGHGAEIALQNTEPVLLEYLRKSAIITSTIASCAIEGIIAPNFEAIALMGATHELTREDRELISYKDALNFVYRLNPNDIKITPDFIQQVHGHVMSHAADAGEYKRKDNIIAEISPDGSMSVRFKPVPAARTDYFMNQLCLYYNDAIQKDDAPKLATIAALTLDLTAIHPFSDGNGRVSRVITTAALISEGYQLPKYISLEEFIQNPIEKYQDALKLSSDGWHDGLHNLEPFLTYQTRVIAKGYRELEIRRQRSNDPITVVLHQRLPVTVRDNAWKEFLHFYPAATLETTNEGVRDTNVKGLRSDLPDDEFEKLNRPARLIRHIVGAIINKKPDGAGDGSPGGRTPSARSR